MAESTAVAVREPTAIERVREALDARTTDIASLLPSGMDAQRFVRVSLLAVSKNPRLLECDRASVVLSVIEAAEVGLEPTGGVGGAHLVPFNQKGGGKKAQLIYDYRGVQHLIREGGGGEVKTVLVYEGDHFEVFEGTQPRIDHRPKYLTTDPTKITHVYAWPLDHPDKFEVMTKEQVDAIRARSRAANDGPWVTDYGAMARKTVLKRISAWLPLKPSIRAVLERDTERELGLGDDAAAPETVKSRTAEVRERVRSRAKGRQPAKSGPGAPEADAAAETSTPAESAGQRTDTPDAVVEGESREVCGDRLVPVEGPVETCVLPPDHLERESHKSESGKRWPVEGSK